MLAITREDLEKLEDAMLGSDLNSIDELVWFLKNTKMIYVEENHYVNYMELLNQRSEHFGTIYIEPKENCKIWVAKEQSNDKHIIIYIDEKQVIKNV